MVSVRQRAWALIRSMQREDIDEVLANDRAAYRIPWSRGIFLDCLHAGYDCQVLEVDNTVIGHLIIARSADEAHLLNICVHPDYQGRGHGLALLLHGMRKVFGSGARRMYLEVRVSNWPAIRMYQSQGFAVIGKRPGYYKTAEDGERREDALIMARGPTVRQ